MVTHRLRRPVLIDPINDMDDGRIIEQGRSMQIISRTRGAVSGFKEQRLWLLLNDPTCEMLEFSPSCVWFGFPDVLAGPTLRREAMLS
ncbi:hypothetical protein KCP69_19650 [Salmonella enterica subsp. enterica]|nr:hypothetical protein KCP69_19650 [Salmonella enterica subsp. enterica]